MASSGAATLLNTRGSSASSLCVTGTVFRGFRNKILSSDLGRDLGGVAGGEGGDGVVVLLVVVVFVVVMVVMVCVCVCV